VKLAIVAEEEQARTYADLLTVEFARHERLQLLERNEIDRVYREQALSAANKDYLKLGRVLGADGLLLLSYAKEGTNEFLHTRLLAVKPGAIIDSAQFGLPMADSVEWAGWMARHVQPAYPKLAVLAKDAVALSIMNLRGAIDSQQQRDLEVQLTSLAILRLSQEPSLFVLERQRLNLLDDEKVFSGMGDSTFWNGSYLLEGTIDPQGYSKQALTIGARLIPPGGGQSISIEVSGARTNLSEVIGELVSKVKGALKLSSTAPCFDAGEEAQKYYEEAKWALKWNAFQQTQAASESAWALGKHDPECAELRLRSYLPLVAPAESLFNRGRSGFSIHHYKTLQEEFSWVFPTRPRGLAFRRVQVSEEINWQYVKTDALPEPRSASCAIHLIGLYLDYSRTLSPETIRFGAHWHKIGLEVLESASKVLRHYHFVPESQAGAEESLTELRAAARSLAGFLLNAPSVRDSYWPRERFVNSDAMCPFRDGPTIFRTITQYGYLWQERPEDSLAMYRELMSGMAFSYVDAAFQRRDLCDPFLAAWNSEDRARLPELWDGFVQELNGSTNVVCRMEARLLALGEARSEAEQQTCFDELLAVLEATKSALLESRIQPAYITSGTKSLIARLLEMSDRVSETKDRLSERLDVQLSPWQNAMAEEWSERRVYRENASRVEEQKEFLRKSAPFDFVSFHHVFDFYHYSREQAAELKPLFAAYRSNLLAQAKGVDERGKWRVESALSVVGRRERLLDQRMAAVSRTPANGVLSASVPGMTKTRCEPQKPSNPPAIAKSGAAKPAPENILSVGKFHPIPLDALEGGEVRQPEINARHVFDDKVVLDVTYGGFIYSFDAKGNWKHTKSVVRSSIAILDLETERWDVVNVPGVTSSRFDRRYHRTVLLGRDLFISGEAQISHYDLETRLWRSLTIPEVGDCELFAVHGRMFAANAHSIIEILDKGNATRILASTRRYPAASELDKLDGFPNVTLFAGPSDVVRAHFSTNIYSWQGGLWQHDAATLSKSVPEPFNDGVLLREAWALSSLPDSASHPELCLAVKPSPISTNNPAIIPVVFRRPEYAQPVWQLPDSIFHPSHPATFRGNDLYLLCDHSTTRSVLEGDTLVKMEVLERDGCHAELLCFLRGSPNPRRLLLRFSDPRGCPPATGTGLEVNSAFYSLPGAWIFCTSKSLIMGRENRPFWPSVGIGCGYGPGVWTLPLSEVDAALAFGRCRYPRWTLHWQPGINGCADLLSRRVRYRRMRGFLWSPCRRPGVLTGRVFSSQRILPAACFRCRSGSRICGRSLC
jgi:hypothetical protein